MTNPKLQYRGVSYAADQHEHPSQQPVEHVYRGQHFNAPLGHDPAAVNTEVELQYRGATYHHRAKDAADQVNAG